MEEVSILIHSYAVVDENYNLPNDININDFQ